MAALTLIYAYFDNPKMFMRQLEEWSAYSQKMKGAVEIIVVDDCSASFPLRDIPVPADLGISIRRFELTKKVPWNWLACRNLGAKKASSKWILLTDMDHLVSVKSASKLLGMLHTLNHRYVYLFTRLDAPNNTKYKPHNDSFLMTKKLFWNIGGYDEELSGHYGTSGRFRNRAFDIASGHYRLPIPLTRFSREVIDDASTTVFVRKGKGRDPMALRRIEMKKKKEGRADEIRTLSFPYKEII